MSLLLAELLGESQTDTLIPKEMLKEQSQDHTLTLILTTNGSGYNKNWSFEMILGLFKNLLAVVSTFNFNFYLKGKLQGEQGRWF